MSIEIIRVSLYAQKELQELGRQTFFETFSSVNTEENRTQMESIKTNTYSML
jgi:hypothetical protein